MRLIAILILSCLLSACIFRPYKFDITQGNAITPEQVSQIEPGMSEEQVQTVLGAPLLDNVFNANRWDYIYYEKPGYKIPLRKHIVVYFDNGRVTKISEDPLINASAAVA